MATSLTGGSGSDFIFQVSKSDIIPAVGMGFDAIGGQAMDAVGFEPPGPAGLVTEQRDTHKSKYFAIYDASSLEDAATFDMETAGGGWGASEGMTFDASARVKTTATSFTVHFNGASTSTQETVKGTTPLSDTARQVLKSGIANFIVSYGSHFVAGYIYGKLCKLSYNMQFNWINSQVAFTASYKQSASEAGFNESTNAKLSNTLTQSNTKCSINVESNCRGYPTTVSPSNFEELIVAKSDFDKATVSQSPTPIAIIVMPWYYLEEVSSQIGLAKNDLQILAPLLNKWIYISNTCQKFINDDLYTGNTQLSMVRGVLQQATAAQTGLLDVLAKCNAKGSSLDIVQGVDGVSVNGTKFAYPDEMFDDMNFALRNFALSFSVVESAGSVLGGLGLVDLQGNVISVKGQQANGQAGSYFSWSHAHAGDWEGTRGTQSQRNDIASFNGSSRVGLVLDESKGTVQCWYCGAGEQLSQNLRNDPTLIRGKATSKNCDDPQNRDRIHCSIGKSDHQCVANVRFIEADDRRATATRNPERAGGAGRISCVYATGMESFGIACKNRINIGAEMPV